MPSKQSLTHFGWTRKTPRLCCCETHLPRRLPSADDELGPSLVLWGISNLSTGLDAVYCAPLTEFWRLFLFLEVFLLLLKKPQRRFPASLTWQHGPVSLIQCCTAIPITILTLSRSTGQAVPCLITTMMAGWTS